MNTKHTPGPWSVDLETGQIDAANGQVTIGRIYGSDDYPCLDLGDDDEGVRAFVTECQANARLIAAAPDLLQATRELLARLDSVDPEKTNSPMRQRARQVIATATCEGAG